ncbi:unnamed protein product [Arctogadus glacialis]
MRRIKQLDATPNKQCAVQRDTSSFFSLMRRTARPCPTPGHLRAAPGGGGGLVHNGQQSVLSVGIAKKWQLVQDRKSSPWLGGFWWGRSPLTTVLAWFHFNSVWFLAAELKPFF